MQTKLKNCKTKKHLRKPKLQHGCNGRASRASPANRASANANANEMPSAFYKLQLKVKQQEIEELFPEVPTHIPNFTITVKINDLEELKKIFNPSFSLNKLITLYEFMHSTQNDESKLQDIHKKLDGANKVFKQMIFLLQQTYIYVSGADPQKALNADKWCNYIQKLIELNESNMAEIDKYSCIKH